MRSSIATHRIKPQLQDFSDDEVLSDAPAADSHDETSDDEPAPMYGEVPSSDSEDEGPDEEEPSAAATLSQISFGALARAQSSLHGPTSSSSKKSSRIASVHDRSAPVEITSRNKKRSSASPEPRARPQKRESKNAPTEMSSKRAVTRKREAVTPIEKLRGPARDPRFDTAVNGVFREDNFKRNYAFLDQYQDDEIKSLKERIKLASGKGGGKDGKKKKSQAPKVSYEELEEMKGKLKSMESKRQSQADKDRVKKVMSEHRREEREKVKEGKGVWHLKKSEIKKKALEEKYKGLSEKQVEQMMARKEKRQAQKEKKNLPWARRSAA